MKIVEKEIKEEIVEDEELVENTSTEKVNNETKKKSSSFVNYLNGMVAGFFDSFRYNKCKLAGILVALPGLFIGFFLGVHSAINGTMIVKEGEINLSGFYMFILVLFGCINIFNGFTLSSKKNLGTVVVSGICSLVITIVGILWIYCIFHAYNLVQSGEVQLIGGLSLTIDHYLSIISVILAIVSSITGCILGYINRNKEYKKVVF